MEFRLLVATENSEFGKTLRELTEAARAMLPIQLEVLHASSLDQVRERLVTWRPDALMLDWNPAQANMMGALADLLADHADLRVMILLPDSAREYREAVWRAGACACIPRDRADPEWLQAVLCVMNRARDREARIRSGVR